MNVSMPNILLLMMKNNQDMLLRLLLNLREQELDLQVHSMSLFYHLPEPTNTELYGSSTFTVEFNPEVRPSRSSSMLFCAAASSYFLLRSVAVHEVQIESLV